jgi:O-acetyl-ADP-ribose deacetylase (regulator of RNase III)
VIHTAHGNLLKAPVEALVNTVNTEGVMGKGIALQFKRVYPEMFKAYASACKAGQVRLGEMWVWQTGALEGPRLVVNFPTKGHWKTRSRLADIEAGLVDLVQVIDRYHVRSIAVPPLGCGNGGLAWSVVRPIIETSLAPLDGVDVHLYAPEGAPLAAEMATTSERPSMTPGKAALVLLVAEYGARAFDVSLIEAQKLMYFVQEAGEPLRLDYVKHRYGPYAHNLDHVLRAVEGHFLSGFGDGSRKVSTTEPLTVLPGAYAQAAQVIDQHPELRRRIGAVLQLVNGFESAYDLELLATVHWIATRDDAQAITDPMVAGDLVRHWSQRKGGLFGQAHVETAWAQLRDEGWFERIDRGVGQLLPG